MLMLINVDFEWRGGLGNEKATAMCRIGPRDEAAAEPPIDADEVSPSRLRPTEEDDLMMLWAADICL